MFERILFRHVATAAVLIWLFNTAGAVTIETVPVGNPGNAPDTTGHGAVPYEYRIGKYEVTAGQYAEFLNAVAGTDTHGLYSTAMWSSTWGCKIQRTGSPGNYSYSVATDRANRPVNFISWGDAARFVNWLHNGQPTSGVQDLTTTEDGAYFLDGATTDAALMAITRENDAIWFIPTGDEWYKAAYHKNDGVTGNYWDYPTKADASNKPSNDLIDPDPGNNANFYVWVGDYTLGAPYYSTEVGEFENSEGPYGTFDQGGNVSEWNESVITDSTRGFAGGGWNRYSPVLDSTNWYGLYPSYKVDDDVGFRVACIPEPGSLVLLLCGLATASIWRRH